MGDKNECEERRRQRNEEKRRSFNIDHPRGVRIFVKFWYLEFLCEGPNFVFRKNSMACSARRTGFVASGTIG